MSKDSIYATPAVPLVAPSAAPTPTVLVPAAESVVKQEAAAAPSPSSTSAEAPSVVVSQPSAQHIKHEDPTATLAAFGLGPEFAGLFNQQSTYTAAPLALPIMRSANDTPPSNEPVIPTSTVFLSRLSPTSTEAQLAIIGGAYGKVKTSRFVKKVGEGKSFGFVTFDTITEASLCIEKLTEKGYKIGYARETLKEKLDRLSDPFETNVYVKNLPADTTQQSLEILFAPHVIVSTKILDGGKGGAEGKGVALVRLQTRDEAHQMVDKLHGHILPNGVGPLVVRFADNSAQKTIREEAARQKRQASSGSGFDDVGSPNSSVGLMTPNTPPYQLLPQGLLFSPEYSPAQIPSMQQSYSPSAQYKSLPTGYQQPNVHHHHALFEQQRQQQILQQYVANAAAAGRSFSGSSSGLNATAQPFAGVYAQQIQNAHHQHQQHQQQHQPPRRADLYKAKRVPGSGSDAGWKAKADLAATFGALQLATSEEKPAGTW